MLQSNEKFSFLKQKVCIWSTQYNTPVANRALKSFVHIFLRGAVCQIFIWAKCRQMSDLWPLSLSHGFELLSQLPWRQICPPLHFPCGQVLPEIRRMPSLKWRGDKIGGQPEVNVNNDAPSPQTALPSTASSPWPRRVSATLWPLTPSLCVN